MPSPLDPAAQDNDACGQAFPDEPPDDEPVQCCVCDQPAVGYWYGEPYCAACYQSEPAFWDKPC